MQQDMTLPAGPAPAQDAAPAQGAAPRDLMRVVERGLRSNHRGFRERLSAGQQAEAVALLGLDVPAGAERAPFWQGLGDALVAFGCDAMAGPVYEQALPALVGVEKARTVAAYGLCLVAAGRTAQGEMACGQARGKAPHLPEVHVALGRARLVAGKVDGAERVIRHALKLAPGEPTALAALAAVMARRGKLAEALQQLEEALASRPGPRLLLQKARVLANAGDWAAAERLARQVASSWPWSGVAQRILAQSALLRGDAAAAIPPAAQAAALASEDPEVFALWSEALRLAGQASQAVQAARRGLQRHPAAARLHAALGMGLMTAGQVGDAAEALRQAVRLAPEDQLLAGNLLAALAASGAVEESVAFARSLLQRPGLAPPVAREARSLLGRALLQLGRGAEARDALAPLLDDPEGADPQIALLHARALRHSGARAGALAALRKILAARPGDAGAAAEVAALASAVRDWPAAEAVLRRALEASPENAELCGLLGEVLRRAGRNAEALSWFLRAHRQVPQDWRHKRASGEALTVVQASETRVELESLTSRALAEAWARPKDLAPMAVSLLRQSAKAAWLFRADHRPQAGDLQGLAGMSLLQRLLRATPVPDWAFEQAIGRLRRVLLGAALGRGDGPAFDDHWLLLAACVADHCWLTDYALAESAEETAIVEELGQSLAQAIAAGLQPAAAQVVMAAAYRNLGRLPQAERLLSAGWPEAMLPLLRRHLSDPPKERKLAAEIPALGEIADPVSRQVMAHYDRAPYPRWSAVPVPPAAARLDPNVGQSLQAVLRSRFPLLPADLWPRAGAAEILDAGCGTGQLTLEMAASYVHRGFTAMDLSRRALAYAARKCGEAGVDGIRFIQGDVMQLPATGWSFDLVNALGLLHHLADPADGWRALTAVTRPGGLQRIGLYSRQGRIPVAAARQVLVDLVDGDPDDAALRALRPQLLSMVDDPTREALTRAPDYYALGTLRDMLFHVREHVFDLPAIAALLESQGLDFLGFDLPDPGLYAAYGAFAPDDPQMRDLDSWARFEAANPATFRGMYIFWARKSDR
ncbi:MAG: methyltransferase domain-containing protein [Sneathiellaceae bacterium]